jgi:hypothetical protein
VRSSVSHREPDGGSRRSQSSSGPGCPPPEHRDPRHVERRGLVELRRIHRAHRSWESEEPARPLDVLQYAVAVLRRHDVRRPASWRSRPRAGRPPATRREQVALELVAQDDVQRIGQPSASTRIRFPKSTSLMPNRKCRAKRRQERTACCSGKVPRQNDLPARPAFLTTATGSRGCPRTRARHGWSPTAAAALLVRVAVVDHAQ